jgi:hypothetical protein
MNKREDAEIFTIDDSPAGDKLVSDDFNTVETNDDRTFLLRA